jgi:hypothetical protein
VRSASGTGEAFRSTRVRELLQVVGSSWPETTDYEE